MKNNTNLRGTAWRHRIITSERRGWTGKPVVFTLLTYSWALLLNFLSSIVQSKNSVTTILLSTCSNSKPKIVTPPNAGEDTEKRHLLHVGGNTSDTATREDSLAVSLKMKQNIYLPYNPAILHIYVREMKIYVHPNTCTWMFMQPICSSQYLETIHVLQWVDGKLMVVCPYHGILLSIKRNEATWMDLKGTMLSEKKAHLKRLQTLWFHLYDIHGMRKLQRMKNRLSSCQELGTGVGIMGSL